MNTSFGGKQPSMRDTEIEREAGFLGPHSRTLSVGDVDRLNFAEDADNAEGQFWLSLQQRQEQRHDVPTGETKLRERKKDELAEELVSRGKESTISRRENHTKKELQEKVSLAGIELKVRIPVVRKGWLGKPCGLKQVLLWRGWIDETRLAEYTKDGPRSEDGDVDLSKPLLHLVESCSDFANERTHLQELCVRFGVESDRTPKYHAEFAGEGIEYIWGCAKGFYRKQPMARKKEKRIVQGAREEMY